MRIDCLFTSLAATLTAAQQPAATPIRLHPDNPRCLEWHGRATALITSAERYGAVLNPDFEPMKPNQRLSMQRRPMKPRTLTLAALALAIVLGTSAYPGTANPPAPARVLLFSGQNNHDWKATTPKLKSILTGSGRFTVQVTDRPDQCTADMLAACDLVVSDWNAWGNPPVKQWPPATREAFLEFIRRGGGYVSVHAGSSSFYDWPDYQKIGGMYWNLAATSHGSPHEFPVQFTADHPITRGLAPFRTKDELWLKPGVHPDARVLATGEGQPLAVTTALGQGRGFALLLGHSAEFMDNPGFQTLLLRGAEWAATGAVTLHSAESSAQAAPSLPLKVSDSKRHLVDQQGKP